VRLMNEADYSGKTYALVIANSEFDDKQFSSLKSPVKDASELKRLLELKSVFNCNEVVESINDTREKLKIKIENFFLDKELDDYLIIYYSGHGLKAKINGADKLFFPAKNTQYGNLLTAIDSELVYGNISIGKFKKVVVILDCCHADNRPSISASNVVTSIKTEVGVDSEENGLVTQDFLEEKFDPGEGVFVLCSSRYEQYSADGSEGEMSLFTHYLCEGITTGLGKKLTTEPHIKIIELYEYILEKIKLHQKQLKKEAKHVTIQTPVININSKQFGHFLISKNNYKLTHQKNLNEKLLSFEGNITNSLSRPQQEELSQEKLNLEYDEFKQDLDELLELSVDKNIHRKSHDLFAAYLLKVHANSNYDRHNEAYSCLSKSIYLAQTVAIPVSHKKDTDNALHLKSDSIAPCVHYETSQKIFPQILEKYSNPWNYIIVAILTISVIAVVAIASHYYSISKDIQYHEKKYESDIKRYQEKYEKISHKLYKAELELRKEQSRYKEKITFSLNDNKASRALGCLVKYDGDYSEKLTCLQMAKESILVSSDSMKFFPGTIGIIDSELQKIMTSVETTVNELIDSDEYMSAAAYLFKLYKQDYPGWLSPINKKLIHNWVNKVSRDKKNEYKNTLHYVENIEYYSEKLNVSLSYSEKDSLLMAKSKKKTIKPDKLQVFNIALLPLVNGNTFETLYYPETEQVNRQAERIFHILKKNHTLIHKYNFSPTPTPESLLHYYSSYKPQSREVKTEVASLMQKSESDFLLLGLYFDLSNTERRLIMHGFRKKIQDKSDEAYQSEFFVSKAYTYKKGDMESREIALNNLLEWFVKTQLR